MASDETGAPAGNLTQEEMDALQQQAELAVAEWRARRDNLRRAALARAAREDREHFEARANHYLRDPNGPLERRG